MPEIIVQGGYSDEYVDPLRFYLRDANRPGIDHQDPAVVARCPEILRNSLKIICRFTDLSQLETLEDITTDGMGLDVSYVTPEGHTGLLDIGAIFTVTDPTVPEFDLKHSVIHLGAQALGTTASGIRIAALKHDAIVRHTESKTVAGSMGDLNFVQNLFEKIEQKAFPKKK